MKINKNTIIYTILIFFISLLGWKIFTLHKMIDEQTIQLSSKNTDDNKHTVVVYDQNLETLKKNNEELYDSLKIYKEQINYLAQFKYSKKYVVYDTIVKFDTINKEILKDIKEYTYTNKEKNDTLNYKLNIGSTVEPLWYAIEFKVSDKFTLVNKKIDNVNETTIETLTNDTKISEVVVLKTKDKKTFKDRIAIGPSVSGGYSLMNKKFDVIVGVSATFDLW